MVNGMIGLNRKYSLKECMLLASQFTSREDWKRGHKSSYACARLAGWSDQCTAHMTKLKKAWDTLDKCKEIAAKFQYRSEWKSEHPSSYTYASRKRWLPQCTAHMKPIGGVSLMEQELLSEIKVKYPNSAPKRFTVKDTKFVAKCFEIDVYVPELNRGIEFNGRYWHSEEQLKRRFPKWKTEDVKRYHELKTDFFKSIGIEVVYIEESCWRADKTRQIKNALDFLSGGL
jgi:hypothetical protein